MRSRVAFALGLSAVALVGNHGAFLTGDAGHIQHDWSVGLFGSPTISLIHPGQRGETIDFVHNGTLVSHYPLSVKFDIDNAMNPPPPNVSSMPMEWLAIDVGPFSLPISYDSVALVSPTHVFFENLTWDFAQRLDMKITARVHIPADAVLSGRYFTIGLTVYEDCNPTEGFSVCVGIGSRTVDKLNLTDAPIVDFGRPFGESILNGVAAITGTARDNDGMFSVDVSVDGGPFAPASLVDRNWTFAWDTRAYAAGERDLLVRARDSSGAEGFDRIRYRLDAPLLTVYTPPNGSFVGDGVSIYARGEDSGGIQSLFAAVGDGPLRPLTLITRYDGRTSDWQAGFDLSAFPAGPLPVRVLARDYDGREVSETRTVIVNRPPEITIEAPAPNSAIKGAFTVRGTASDPDGVGRVRGGFLDSGLRDATGTGAWSLELDATGRHEGTVFLRAVAEDARGASRETIFTLYVNEPPAVSITSPAEGAIVDTFVAFAGHADDAGGAPAISIRIDEGPSLPPASGTPARTFWHGLDTRAFREGSHTLGVVASDAHGWSASASRNFTVNRPPLVSFSPPSYVSGVATLSGTASDGLGLASVDVRLEDGTLLPVEGLEAWNVTFDTRGRSDGLARLTVVATDALGLSRTAVAFTRVDNTPPDVAFITPEPNRVYPPPAVAGPIGASPLVLGGASLLVGPQTIQVAASDWGGVAEVSICVHDDLQARIVQCAKDRTAPYTLAYNVVDAGERRIVATATDVAGNVSPPVEVRVIRV